MLYGQLMYSNTRQVISSTERQHTRISDVHKGLGHDPKVKAMASHCGRGSMIQKISNRFFWHNIKDDIEEFIKKCDQRREQGKIKKASNELHSIPIKTEVMQQIGIMCRLPEVDGFKHLAVCIDYFSKWSEAKPIKNKSASTTAQFLYEVICRHGCMKIQINDQGREFVNEVSKVLHNMSSAEQPITLAEYHPQSNGLCERQNRTIKDALVKVL